MPLRLVPQIHRATHRIGLYLADLGEDAPSQGEAHVLAQLAQADPATVGDLHRGLAHKRSTLTSILDRLEARGFVTRSVGAQDRRTFVIALTPKGKTVARRVLRHLDALEQSVGRDATAAEMNGFLKVVALVEQQAHAQTRTTKDQRHAAVDANGRALRPRAGRHRPRPGVE